MGINRRFSGLKTNKWKVLSGILEDEAEMRLTLARSLFLARAACCPDTEGGTHTGGCSGCSVSRSGSLLLYLTRRLPSADQHSWIPGYPRSFVPGLKQSTGLPCLLTCATEGWDNLLLKRPAKAGQGVLLLQKPFICKRLASIGNPVLPFSERRLLCRGAPKLCRAASVLHIFSRRPASGSSPHSEGVSRLERSQVAFEGSKTLPRKFPKNLQEQRNKATGGEAKREIRVRAVLAKAAISMAQARNGLQWQRNSDCSNQSNRKKHPYFPQWIRRPGKEHFQLKMPGVKHYIKFQFTCTERDLATLAALDPDLGLVSSTDRSLSARYEGWQIALRQSASESCWRISCTERNFLVLQIW